MDIRNTQIFKICELVKINNSNYLKECNEDQLK